MQRQQALLIETGLLMRKMVAQIEVFRQHAEAAKLANVEKEVSKNIAESRVAALLRARGDSTAPKGYQNQYCQTDKPEVESALGEARQKQVDSYSR